LYVLGEKPMKRMVAALVCAAALGWTAAPAQEPKVEPAPGQETTAPLPPTPAPEPVPEPAPVMVPVTPMPPRQPGEAAPALTREQRIEMLAARMRRNAQRDGALVARPGDSFTVSGAVERGDVLLATPVTFTLTGRTLAPVLERPGMFQSEPRELLPAGAPVYGMVYTEIVTGGYAPMRMREIAMWCGAPADERIRRSGAVCFDREQVYRGSGSSPLYAPSSLIPANLLVTPVEVRTGETGDAFANMEVVITFVEWDDEDIDVRQGLRVDGVVYEMRNRGQPRETDGSAVLEGWGGRLVLTQPGRSRREATVQVDAPVTRFTSALPEGEILAIATRMVDREDEQAAREEAQRQREEERAAARRNRRPPREGDN